ncbi:hypothetical protein ACU045_13885 [Microbacterium sp. MAHUQ-60]|uniref:hypothetical protein n=1 Tax=unclassified Microbacterium TaxID=2609290 RepID=UPI0036202D5C
MGLRDRVLGVTRTALGIFPDRMLSRALPGALGWNDATMVTSEVPPAGVRLLIAPVNSAGQAYLWARAAREHLVGVEAVNLMTTNAQTERFGFPSDLSIPESGYIFARGWQRRQRRAIIDGFTHMVVESGRHPYGSVPGRTPLDAVHDLTASGIALALVWHGSDIRIPSVHARWEADSPFGERGHYPPASTALLERNSRERRSLISETSLPVFVSTPGLLDVPRATWLPVVVDTDRWRSDQQPLRESRPTVAYVPSNSPMKGDPVIDEQLSQLDAEGAIRYVRLEGVPAAEMPGVYRQADIVLDQFRLGDYGVAACEAMAAGRVVVGHVHDDVRARVVARTGLVLPIVESRYADVDVTIRAILNDRTTFRDRAAAGVEYVREVHDGRMSARVLSDFLGAVPAAPGAEEDPFV